MGRSAYDTTGTPRPLPSPIADTLCPSDWETILWANAPLLKLRKDHRELTKTLTAFSSTRDDGVLTAETDNMPEDIQRVQRSFVRSLISTAQTINTLPILDIPSVHSDALLEAFRLATSRSRICPDVDSAIINLQNSRDTGWRRSSAASTTDLPFWAVDPGHTVAVQEELQSLCSTYDTCLKLLGLGRHGCTSLEDSFAASGRDTSSSKLGMRLSVRFDPSKNSMPQYAGMAGIYYYTFQRRLMLTYAYNAGRWTEAVTMGIMKDMRAILLKGLVDGEKGEIIVD